MEGDWSTWIFGLGPGQTSPLVLKSQRFNAVWSVLLPYIYQNGLIGLAAVVCLGYFLLRIWRASGFDAAYLLMLLVWLVGITVTTSYVQLLPLWLALGWFSVWPSLCEPQAKNLQGPRHRGLPLVRSESRMRNAATQGRMAR